MQVRMRISLSLVAILLLTRSSGLHAQQIRKWEDNGRTIYSDIRPSATAREVGSVSGASKEIRLRPVETEKRSSAVAPPRALPNVQPGAAMAGGNSGDALRKSLESLREIQNKAEERRRIID
jgi:hypothetical protein